VGVYYTACRLKQALISDLCKKHAKGSAPLILRFDPMVINVTWHFMLPFCLVFIFIPKLGSPVSSVIHFYQQLKQLAEQSMHRQLCCLQGSQQWCFEQATSIIASESIDYKWCGKAPSSIISDQYASLLGQDVPLLILNMSPQFDANMFAAAEGSVQGGSVIIILLPETIMAEDYFTAYILQQLKLNHFPIIKHQHALPSINQTSATTALTTDLFTEQKQAILQIIKTATGHRRRPLVITANRGRGKSAALGIAIATLINQGFSNILVCAPNKQAVATLYKHLISTLFDPATQHAVTFIAPDALHQQQPPCNLLVIDEAAAIPIKLLNEFTKRYSRIVFATTQFGYEGSGRGFALRFQKQLDQLAPQWRSIHLNQAIRWAENDPVEAFTLSSLCLMEEVPVINVAQPLLKPTIKQLKRSELLEQPAQLNQLFSLLVNAHYQTKPSDLSALLNDKNLTIISMQHQQKIIGVVLINHEGEFEQTISTQIYQGKRRPQGHLFAQSLTFHSGFEQAAMQKYARIQRIAVQPTLQNNQLGTQLLDWTINWATQQNFDHLCASFSANEQLLRFWMRHQLQVLRIGTRRDKSTGQHSFMMNLPLSIEGKNLHQKIYGEFQQQIKVQLSRQLNQLESSIICTIWAQIIIKQAQRSLKPSLDAYINANRSYENVEYLLIELLYSMPLTTLSQQQQNSLISKIIQNQSWQQLVQENTFTGQKQAQTFIKNAICDLLNHNQENT